MINASIPMMGANVDTAAPLNNFATQQNQNMDQQNQNAMSAEQTLRAHYEAMDAREKSRLASTIVGASQLKGFLDKNDVEGAQNFLTQRKSKLHNRMAYGEDIDTQETDYALQALKEGRIDELKNGISGLLAAGQVYGLVDRPSENAYLQQFQAVKQAHPGWTDAQVQDYVYTRGNVGKGTVFDGSGNVVNQPGAVDASAEKAGREKFSEAVGGEAGKKVIANDATLGSLDNLEFSVQQARALVPKVANTGPIFGRTGAAAEDPDYRNLQGAINSITLQAKDLYNLGSGAGFTDADRDFLRQVIAGDYARAETIEAGLQRFEQALANRRRFVTQQNQQYNQQYGGAQPSPQQPQGNPQAGGGQRVRVTNGREVLMIDPSDLAAAQAEGFNQQ